MPTLRPFQIERGASAEASSDRDPGHGTFHFEPATAESPPRDRLAQIVESEIIPRLMLVSAPGPCGTILPSSHKSADPDRIERLARALISQSPEKVAGDMARLLEQGLSIDDLYLGILAPAARRLGEQWETDDLSFMDVTIGVSNLRQVLHRLRPLPFGPQVPSLETKRILIAPTPGEQHAFGLVMVGDYLARAGWDVEGGPDIEMEELRCRVRSVRYDVVGFSLASDALLDALISAIAAVRQHSQNQSVGIVVGGRAFAENARLGALVGADAIAFDAKDGVAKAEEIAAKGCAVQI